MPQIKHLSFDNSDINNSNTANQKPSTKNYLFGFTLVELIVVVVILAILATIAFLSFNSYSESAKDGKRMSNVVLMAKGFEVSITMGKYIDTSDISTVPNIVLSGSAVKYVGYYSTPIKPKLLKSLGLWGGDINDIGTEDYNKYKFTYVPSIQKYQVACILNSKDNFHSFDNSILDNTFAETNSGSGYIFLKGNYFGTGGVEGLIPKQEVWDTTPGETKVIAGDKILTNGVSNEPTNANCIFSGSTVFDGDSLLLYSENNIVWSAGYSCTDRLLTRTCNNGSLSGDDSYKHSVCVKGTPNNCVAGNYSNSGTQTYNLPSILNHSLSYSGVTNIAITNGTKAYTADISCNDGVVNIVNESLNGSCNTNYNWNSSTSSCDAGTQVTSCTGLPTNAVWNTASSITQTWNGISWSPSVVGSYNTTSSSSSCVYQCAGGYHYSNGSCIQTIAACPVTITTNNSCAGSDTHNNAKCVHMNMATRYVCCAQHGIGAGTSTTHDNDGHRIERLHSGADTSLVWADNLGSLGGRYGYRGWDCYEGMYLLPTDPNYK